MNSFRLPLRCLAFLLVPLSAAAAAAPDPRVELAAFKVVVRTDAAGGTHESLEPLVALAPGDVVEYVARCHHAGGGAVRDLQVTVPVPAGGLEFLSAAPGPAPLDASTDGRRFAPAPLRRTVRRPDGRSATEPVPLAAYRALRWTVAELKAGETRVFRARMVLPADAAATAPPADAAVVLSPAALSPAGAAPVRSTR